MLGEKLRELRTELNLNMKQASEKLGISYTTYVGYEKNEREPNSETLIKLADFYKCSVDYLIGKTMFINSNSDSGTNIHKEKLITNYAALNNFGKNKLLEYSNDLICSGNYKKDTYKIKTAARNGSFNETTVTDDDFQKLMDLPDVDDLK